MSIGNQIYNLHWYQLPRSEQFIVQLMIQRANRPFTVKGLDVFVCSLEVFLKVIETSQR